LFLLIKKYKKKYIIIFKFILPITIFGISTFHIWGENASFMINKFGASQDTMIYSRFTKWENRLLEFESSPFFGIGFSSVNLAAEQNNGDLTGLIEPGSSWLALLSMTGIFGFLSFLYLIGSLKSGLVESPYANYLLSYGLFFMIHFIAEGYIFASGNLLFFCFAKKRT
jgi:O-antigen ligase